MKLRLGKSQKVFYIRKENVDGNFFAKISNMWRYCMNTYYSLHFYIFEYDSLLYFT